MLYFLKLLVVLGLVWWLTTLLPLPDPIPLVIKVVVILALIWELLSLAGYTKSPFRPK